MPKKKTRADNSLQLPKGKASFGVRQDHRRLPRIKDRSLCEAALLVRASSIPLDALEDGVTSIVLVNFLSPHAGQIRFGSQGMQKAMCHCRARTTISAKRPRRWRSPLRKVTFLR